MVSDALRVPFADAMLVRVPSGDYPLAVASASDNLPDAYRTVAPQLQLFPGAPVLIVGGSAKSIGLYAVGIARALGSSRIDYLDRSQSRLSLAAELGANRSSLAGVAQVDAAALQRVMLLRQSMAAMPGEGGGSAAVWNRGTADEATTIATPTSFRAPSAARPLAMVG